MNRGFRLYLANNVSSIVSTIRCNAGAARWKWKGGRETFQSSNDKKGQTSRNVPVEYMVNNRLDQNVKWCLCRICHEL